MATVKTVGINQILHYQEVKQIKKVADAALKLLAQSVENTLTVSCIRTQPLPIIQKTPIISIKFIEKKIQL